MTQDIKPPKHQKMQDVQRYQHLKHTSYRPKDPLEPEEKAPVIKRAKRSRKLFGWKRALFVIFLLLLIPVLVIGIWDYKNFASASQKLFGTTSPFPLLLPSELQSTSQGRVNILLVGYSVDDPGHAGATLTDSILVVSLDKVTKTGYMLSVPRDLYVQIPDYGQAKINEAYQAGEFNSFLEPGYSPGGIGLLEKVISNSFGIKIHYHAIINYTSVRDIVDALGGVTVNIESPDPRGLYDPNFRPVDGGQLRLSNGPQQLDGVTALKLTRARGATFNSYGFPQSDFNRIQNQQKVFAAIKKELNWTLVLDPRTNGKIFDAAANNIKTDVRLSEVVPLYRLFVSIPDSSLRSVTLHDVDGVNLLRSYSTTNGQSALIPAAGLNDYEQIQATLNKLNNQN